MLEKHIITKDVDSNESEKSINAIDCIRNIHNAIDLKRLLKRAKINAKPNRLNTLNIVVIRHSVPACN